MAPATPETPPPTIVLDAARLLATHKALAAGDTNLLSQLEVLQRDADGFLSKGPWSVTTQETCPPSGNFHDYASQAPYWWQSADGATYERRDGCFNPEAARYTAKGDRARLFAACKALSLAWYYTRQVKYAQHCAHLIRVWFVDENTRMTPHLEHAQMIPGQNTGRAIGIIDWSMGHSLVLDAINLLRNGREFVGDMKTETSAFWRPSFEKEMLAWNRQFLAWLTASPFGREERAEKNNHGTFAASHIAALAFSVGDVETAREAVSDLQACIDAQIAPDGSQPLELARSRSWHYSVFNLVAMVRGAAVSRKLCGDPESNTDRQSIVQDLWKYIGPAGQSIPRAIAFLLPAATGCELWKYPELNFQPAELYGVVAAAASAGFVNARVALGDISRPEAWSWELYPAV